VPIPAQCILNGHQVITTSAITESARSLWDFSRLTGPIFDKELRVSSRRQRNYILRSAYVVLLAVFVAVVWAEQAAHLKATVFRSSNLFWASRMSEAGKRIVMTIVWFQFCATQFIAIVMLSTSINDEVYGGTLNTLMTTPITSFQIVMGKLLSKLFQLILLVAISLPLLAIVRIFGGVPWDYVISSLCITLTAVILAGSVSLFFSIVSRKAYVVIILTVLALSILFGLFWFLPIRVFGLSPPGRQASASITALFHLNPYMLQAWSTDVMLNPRMGGRMSVSLFSHCGIMLVATAAVLLACVCLVRKIALAQTSVGAALLSRLWRRRAGSAKSATSVAQIRSSGRIRRVNGPPVMWRELISRRSSGEKIFTRTIIGTELAMVAAMYLFPYVVNVTSMEWAHAAYIGIFMGLGALSVTVFPATCIASEKEARSWPLLLTTTVTDWEILCGKFVGVLRRSLPIWLILIVYLIPYWGVATFGVLEVAALAIGTTVFLCGTGFYASSRLSRTNVAVAANFVLATLVWVILPALLVIFGQGLRPGYGRSLLDSCWQAVPFVRAMEAMGVNRRYDPPESTLYILGYVLLGIIFAWLAKRQFRRSIFHHVI
jgi:ABC-type transport system involved in multi-copper enzyme maturation permease subunit